MSRKQMLFTGDINLMNVTDPALPFNRVLDTLHSADMLFGNLECCFYQPPASVSISDEGFFAAPAAGRALQLAGFRAVGNANNVNYGADAIRSSLSELEKLGIPFTGAGRNRKQARAPVIIEHGGLRYGFVQRTSVYWPTNHEAGEHSPGVAALRGHTAYQLPLHRISHDIPPANRPGVPPLVVTWGARAGRVGPGAGVGGLAIFARDPLGSEVVAEEDTLTLELDRDAVAEVLEDRYFILHHILREMSRRAIDLVTRFRLDPAAGMPECPVDIPQSGDIDLVSRIFFLRRMSVFQRSSVTALAEMARAMAQVRFEPGTVLWREGEPSPGIFLVRAGRVRATGSRGVAFRPGPGFPLGALEALGEVPRFYEAVTETPVVALQGHMGVLVDVFEDHFGTAMDYLAVVAQSTLRILDWAAARGEPAPLPT